MQTTSVRAVLFDYGGVLTVPIGLGLGRFFAETGVDPDRFRDFVAGAYAPPGASGSASGPTEPGSDLERWHGSALVASLETGRITVGEFDRALARALSEGLASPLDPDGLSARLFGGLEPDPAMIAVAAAIRARGFATAIVSNTWGTPPGLPREGFDAILLSHAEGCRKPEPEIYRRAASRLGVEPEACVFVDDIASNIQGAEAVGMEAVLHRHASTTIPRMEHLLGVRLSRP